MKIIYQFLLSFFIGVITFIIIGYGLFGETGLTYGILSAIIWGLVCVIALISIMKKQRKMKGERK